MIVYQPKRPDHDQHYRLLTESHQDWDINRKERVIDAFTKSDFAVSAEVDDIVVGTVRAITDTVGFTLIADLLIHPQYRRQGIATELVKMVMAQYPTCYLYADPGSNEAHALYQKMKFEERSVYLYRPDQN